MLEILCLCKPHESCALVSEKKSFLFLFKYSNNINHSVNAFIFFLLSFCELLCYSLRSICTQCLWWRKKIKKHLKCSNKWKKNLITCTCIACIKHQNSFYFNQTFIENILYLDMHKEKTKTVHQNNSRTANIIFLFSPL